MFKHQFSKRDALAPYVGRSIWGARWETTRKERQTSLDMALTQSNAHISGHATDAKVKTVSPDNKRKPVKSRRKPVKVKSHNKRTQIHSVV